MIDMDEDTREQLYQQFITIKLPCSRHSQEIANMFISDQESQYKGFICSTCYSEIIQSGTKIEGIVFPSKFILSQIHQTCSKLMTQLSISSFVDYYLNNTLQLAREFSCIKQSILQTYIFNFFKKYRNYLNGVYFEQYYRMIKQITFDHNSKMYNKDQTIKMTSKKLIQFILSFNHLVMQCQDYSSLAFQQKLNGKFLVKQIKAEIQQVYKQIKEKISKLKKNQNNEEQILHLLNPNQSSDFSKHYRFSTSLSHPNILIVEPKKMKMPNHPDNQYTLLSLIEPAIGSKKKSINFKMDGIKGWVSIGIAIRKKVEQNGFKFESTNSHGTFQISYDGYGWSDDSSSNQHYTSWYYNQGDTINLTVNPSSSELTFVRNNQQSNAYVMKYKSEKKDKLYFCVAVNYNEDSVSIIQ